MPMENLELDVSTILSSERKQEGHDEKIDQLFESLNNEPSCQIFDLDTTVDTFIKESEDTEIPSEKLSEVIEGECH